MNTPRISPFSHSLISILGVLNAGLAGKHGTVTVTANGRGMRIVLNRRTLAAGRTPEELHANFTARQKAAVQSGSSANRPKTQNDHRRSL